MNVFLSLKALPGAEYTTQVDKAIESLQSSHARVHKTLLASGGAKSAKDSESLPSSGKTTSVGTPREKVVGRAASAARPSPRAASAARPSARAASVSAVSKAASSNVNKGPPPKATPELESLSAPDFDESMHHLDRLRIPEWDLSEDDGGVRAGLASSKWAMKNSAIIKLISFVVSGDAENVCSDVSKNANAILAVTREHTKGFKESNVNLMKSILNLFIEVCNRHESLEVQLPSWPMSEGVNAAVQKIQDKKLTELCFKLLTSFCIVCRPTDVLLRAVAAIEQAKSPIAHEMLLAWFNSFCKDFGARAMSQGVAGVVPWLIDESGSTNPKVKKELNIALSELHMQLGPTFRALALQLSQGYNREMMEQTFEASPFDPSQSTLPRPKQSIATDGMEGNGAGELVLDVPKTDLNAVLQDRIISRMNSKEGKTAWKIRKEAIEELSAALKGCNSLIDASSSQKLRFLIELARALRDRLSDTQTNLRPLAARTVGEFLENLDKSSKGRIGKIVYPTLMGSAINEIKKPMRDAAMEALRSGTKSSSLEGSGSNRESLEALFVSFADVFNENALRAIGLGDLLVYLGEHVNQLPNFLEISSNQGISLGEKYAKVLVECLTSSKSDVRSAALSLIEGSIENNVISFSICDQAVDKMKPAKQRSVAPMIAKLKKVESPKGGEKENVPSTDDIVEAPNDAAHFSQSVPPPSLSKASTRSQESSTSSREQITRSRIRAPAQTSQPPASPRHPLVSRISKGAQPKPVAWPTFPEEPNAPMVAGLKKSWSASLPAPSAAILFPQTGIKKQDDAQEGCELLENAIELDSEGASDVVESQFDHILKWISFVLCCKEATVGLQALLSLIQKLFSFLIANQRELSEKEVGIIVPFLIEKASNAKGRFRDTFMDILDVLQDGSLVSPKILGTVACIQVIESSNQARARALAYSMCRDCVVSSGLAGIGKRGTLVAAKAYSRESLPETKSAALDLMEELVRKMNNDVNRLVKICGSSLSEQARVSIEERWAKASSRKEPTLVPASPARSRPASPARSRHMSPAHSRQLSPNRRQYDSALATPDRPTSFGFGRETPASERSANLRDELPALSLRDRMQQSVNERERNRAIGNSNESSVEPYAFSSMATAAESRSSPREPRPSFPDSIQPVVLNDSNQLDPPQTTSSQESNGTLGTAASLRARLLKIKEKNKQPETERQDATSSAKEFDDITAIDIESNPRDEYKSVIAHVKALMRRPTPLQEDDADIQQTTRSLKKVHTALAHNGERSDGTATLKTILVENLSDLINLLLDVIGFSLNSQEQTHNAGISIPLLSVSLATLMALFRFPDVASNVHCEDLTNLLKRTATILLDPRFSAQSDLDDATCAQMAKAINKTAVNAATGAPRALSVQALVSVQQELALDAIDSVTEHEKEFNGRLSRVISRLFVRVLKAEESGNAPYANVDMEAIVCCMEDTLEGCKYSPSDACKEMVSNLLESILKVQKSASPLGAHMKTLGISTETSSLGLLLKSLAPVESAPPPARSLSPTKLERNVAELVDSLGNSREGPERDGALAALRRHQEEYGKGGLEEYLQEVSPAFRSFIEEQLASGATSPGNSEKSSMSVKLRNLRSRLQATELTIQTAPEETELPKPTRNRKLSVPSISTGGSTISSSSVSSSRPQSRLAQPSPSKASRAQGSMSRSRLAQPSPSKASRTPSAHGSRDRFASNSTSALPPAHGSATRTTAAANLRARLEAVKNVQN